MSNVVRGRGRRAAAIATLAVAAAVGILAGGTAISAAALTVEPPSGGSAAARVASTESAVAVQDARAVAAVVGAVGRTALATMTVVGGRRVAVVALSDAGGAPDARVRLDIASGRVVSAVHFRRSRLHAAAVGSSGAASVAGRIAAALRLATGTEAPRVAWDDGTEAWAVHWRRVIGGALALGDGVTVRIAADGAVHSVSTFETPTAQEPATPITAAGASAAALAYIHRNGIDRFAGLTVSPPVRAWVPPNDFVAPVSPAVEATALHLAYVVRFAYLPPGWADTHEVQLFVDAATGELIGGTETS